METLSTFVQSPLFSRLSVVLGGLIVVGLFWWRAGSFHIVLDRFWRLVAGKADVHDPVLKSLLLESRDIEKFQFTYRLKVETMADVRKLASWIGTHGIGMARLQKIRRWVDVSAAEIVIAPPKYYVSSHLTFGCLAALAMFGIAQLAATHEAFLQTRVSKVWFKTDANTVNAPLGGWSFGSTECKADKARIAQETGFNASETDAICNGLSESGLKTLVKQTVKLQAWMGIVVVLIMLVETYVNILAASTALNALRLRKRLYPACASGNEPESEAAS